MSLLAIRDLHVSFPSDDGFVRAVRGVDFEVAEGETVAVVGESGSGKSVTALAVMGLLPERAVVSGDVVFDGRSLLPLGPDELRRLRGDRVAMVFQDPMTALNPVFRVGEQVAEAIRAHRDVSGRVAARRAVELLDLVGIPEPRRRAEQYPHEFSGGMRQRALVAMAIANDPVLLIADEPTTALDVTVQAQVMEVLAVAREATGSAMVLITHDLGLVAGTADRVVVMYAGQVVERGTADEVFATPANPYTEGLLASVPSLTEPVRRLPTIPGSPPDAGRRFRGCAFAPRCRYVTAVCQERPPEPIGDRVNRCHHPGAVRGVA